jgi:hydroxymethylglutaryl-CoA reductase
MIKGFSRLSKEEKIQLIIDTYSGKSSLEQLKKVALSDKQIEFLIEGFSENTLSIFPFPYSVAPNFLIDGVEYIVPFVTEESSVVAAASNSAKFWLSRGGFQTQIIGNTKNGQVHFMYKGNSTLLKDKFTLWKSDLFASISGINEKMLARGGGVKTIALVDKTTQLADYFQIDVGFNTCNAMGANYINSCLEAMAKKFEELLQQDLEIDWSDVEIIMSILSNYSPNNAVKVWVEAPVSDLLDDSADMTSEEFAYKFVEAVKIAEIDISRAVTHNKGLYNGVDSVALATGNDWRAIEANGHAFASTSGYYKSLSHASIVGDVFRFEATLPMQVGTVGGITALHPLTKFSMELLKHPSAEELMKIIAAAGLASNFAAVRSLITTGIQKGHMKMHLSNILAGLNVTEKERKQAVDYFSEKTIANAAVRDYIEKLRQ